MSCDGDGVFDVGVVVVVVVVYVFDNCEAGARVLSLGRSRKGATLADGFSRLNDKSSSLSWGVLAISGMGDQGTRSHTWYSNDIFRDSKGVAQLCNSLADLTLLFTLMNARHVKQGVRYIVYAQVIGS
nr:hypothetical protein CFP56_31599 [Quercus suber]